MLKTTENVVVIDDSWMIISLKTEQLTRDAYPSFEGDLIEIQGAIISGHFVFENKQTNKHTNKQTTHSDVRGNMVRNLNNEKTD